MEKSAIKTEWLPRYSYLPCASMAFVHFAVYYGTKPLQAGLTHHSPDIPFDAVIPFLPQWSLIYAMTFVFWIVGAIILMRQDRELCFRTFIGIAIAELICTVFFIAFPTEISRPEIQSTEYGALLLSQMYANDVPVNLFPSMHCMISYMMFRYFMYCRNAKTPYIIAVGLLVALICASTVFVKQHFFIDCISGIVFGELAVWLALRTDAWRLYDQLDRKLFSGKKTVSL